MLTAEQSQFRCFCFVLFSKQMAGQGLCFIDLCVLKLCRLDWPQIHRDPFAGIKSMPPCPALLQFLRQGILVNLNIPFLG